MSSNVLAGSTTLLSTKSQKKQSDGLSSDSSASGTGKFVAFRSSATVLDDRCNSGLNHIFVRDRTAQTTRCISVNSNGNQGNQDSDAPSVSSDGQFIAFDSKATDLAGKCDNGASHIFVHDRVARTTRCVSINSNGNQGNLDSHAPSISSDGRFIAFHSAATNLSGGKCNNGFIHVFVHDLTAGTTTCVSVHSNGAEGDSNSFDPSISANGELVVFHSTAANLTGRCSNGNSHIYLHNRLSDNTSCVSVDSDETESNGNSSLPKISGDGLFVVFQSDATNLTPQCNNGFAQIYIRDLADDRTFCASRDSNGNQGNNDSVQPSISSVGRFIAFSSPATNLVSNRCTGGNKQIFIRDRTQDKTTCASLGPKNVEGNGDSENPSISGDGKVVSFESNSSNLVKKDGNNLSDVFARVLP